ncbi:hypothetical protein Scep_022510 [Stephania cephalantha]|uniref:Uncharacterized protein n=1 Tax=Stephania cephalantha TaxID=152367 RepID=A0AAP0F5I7_9MAGN
MALLENLTQQKLKKFNKAEVDDVVASQLDPKLANTLIRRLNQIAPLDNLRHLKRVRKNFGRGGNTQLSIILCLAHSETLPHNVLDLVNAYHLTPFLTKKKELLERSES